MLISEIHGTLGVPAHDKIEAPATAQTAPERDRLKGSRYAQDTDQPGLGAPMSIQRVPEVPFAQIANSALRDRRLSFKARGVLALVLSNVGEWEATAKWLRSQSDHDGKVAIQTALKELTDLGYREVSYERRAGKVVTIVEWRHIPCPPQNLTSTKHDGQEIGAAIEHHPLEHHQEPEHHRTEQTSAFEEFWQAYPRKASKGAARTAWTKAIAKADPSVIIAAAAAYRDDPNREDGFTAHAATWLNQERWDDEPLPSRAEPSKSEARMRRNMEFLSRLDDDRQPSDWELAYLAEHQKAITP